MHTEQILIEESEVVNGMHELIISLIGRHHELIEQHQSNATAFINQAVVDDRASLSQAALDTRHASTEMTFAEEIQEIMDVREHFTMLIGRHLELAQQHRANRAEFQFANQTVFSR